MSGAVPVLIALTATIAYHFGLIVEKSALRSLPAVHLRRPVNMLATLLGAPAWLGGFSLMLAGLGLQVLALARAPVTVVQPVIASGVVVLLVASRIILRERLRTRELACVLAMAAGVALLALSASGTAGHVGRHASGLAVTAVVAAAGTAALLMTITSDLTGGGRHRQRGHGGWLGCASGLCYGVSALGFKGAASVLAAGQGGWDLVLELARSGYVYLAVAGSAAGLLLFQTALQRFPASIVGPVSNVTGSIFFLVAGSVLFGERLPADPAVQVARLAGIGLTVLIVAVLSARPASADTDRQRHHDDPFATAWSAGAGEPR